MGVLFNGTLDGRRKIRTRRRANVPQRKPVTKRVRRTIPERLLAHGPRQFGRRLCPR